MRASLVTSIGVVCAAALLLPPAVSAAPAPADRAASAGRTQSLPLPPLAAPAADRAGTGVLAGAPAARARGLAARDVAPFALVGVVWDDPSADLSGRVRVRTRATGSGEWSPWQELEAHNDDAPDPGSAERTRGGTLPLWVGDSDGVQARVSPGRSGALPAGLRLQLVDPGGAPAADARALAPAGPPPPLEPVGPADDFGDGGTARVLKGGRPAIVTRKQWGASKKLRAKGFVYTRTVKVAFIHHTATGNHYTCKQSPSVMRSIYRYHVKSMHWRDIGYNFAIDKCGKIYEGRAGGVAKPVRGAHTLGFNSNSTGIAVLGTYSKAGPSAKAVKAVARLAAWKLGLSDRNPRGKATLVSAGSNKYRKGKKVKFHTISGHRDGFVTDCPGSRLYRKLSGTRSAAARLLGR